MELHQLEQPIRQLIHAKQDLLCYFIKSFSNVNRFRVGTLLVRRNSGAVTVNLVGLEKNKIH
jgi:hypothetical protein